VVIGSVRTPAREDARRYWDRVAEDWPPGPPPLWRRQSDAVNGMLVARWLPVAGLERVLKTDLFDELAGEGLYPLLRSRARQVVAVDLSRPAVSAARQRYPDLDAVVADAMELPFQDGYFDAVLSNSTLDHLSSRREVGVALTELARVLRPGGRLVITLDNLLNPLIAMRNVLPRQLARSLRQVPYDAGWTCGPRSLQRLLRESGFEVRELTAVLHVPRVLVARLGPQRSGMGDDSRWLRFLRAGERLERWPTRFVTGHFVAALAVRPP
jgi:SAM-dependent methyltransferase